MANAPVRRRPRLFAMREFPCAQSPEGISLSPDGRLVAAASELANGVVVVDTGAGHASWTLQVPGKNPEHAVFSPDGRWLYVSAEDGAQVDVIDVARRAVVASVPVGPFSNGVVVSPGGARVYVSSGRGARVDVVEVASRRVSASIPVGQRPWGVAIR
jgi:YVTN family beta-propeller protein